MFNGNVNSKDIMNTQVENNLELICVRNPFNRTDREVTSVSYGNQSLAGILQQYIPKDIKVNVSINGKIILKEAWQLTYPQVGEQIVVVPLVAGGDDDKIILNMVLMIAVAWAAPQLVAGLPGAMTAAGELSFLGTLYAAGVIITGGIIISALTPAPQIRQPGYDVSQIYNWSPQTTQQQGLVVPKFYGKNKHFANIFAAHIDIDEDGEKQLLKFAAGLGSGPIKSVSNKKLNDQPIGNYPEVSSEDRLGLVDQTVTTIFGDTEPEYRPNIKVTNIGGAKTYNIPDDDYDDIEVDIFFGRGVYWANDQGGLSNHSIGIKVEVSEYGEESWTTIGEETVTRNSTDRFWKTYVASDEMVITNGNKYKVKVTKTTSDQASMRYGDDVYLSSVREVMEDDFQYPKTAYVAVSALATDMLSSSLRFSCETEDSIVDTYNGTSWTLQWSDNPAWVLYDILTQPVISGDGDGTPYAVERYDGINPSRIDYAKFYELAVFCDIMVPDGSGGTEKRITFNGGFDTPTTMWEAALKVCEIARCALVWNGINVTLAIDKAGDAVQMFSVGNIIKDTFKETFLPESDRASEIELRYIDADQDYKLTPFTIYNSSVNNPANKVTMELFGVNKQSEAWRAGMYRLAMNQYLKTTVDFEADIDAIACTLGDIIYVQHDVPQWGKGGRISSATNNTVTVHRKLLPTNDTDEIMVRNPNDDSMETKTVTGISNNNNWSTLTISGTWTRNPTRGDLFAYGTQNLITKKFRIIDLRKSGDQRCTIKALQNDPEVYTPDGSEPILPALQVTPAESDAVIRPPNWGEMTNRIPQIVVQGLNVDIPLITNLTWNDNTPGAGSVSWTATDGENPILFTCKGITYEITAGNTANEFIYWDLEASTVFSSSASAADMIGTNKWPVCINNSGTADRATGIPVLNAGFLRARTIYAEHYAELRNTYVYNSGDSLDAAKPFTIPFRIIPEADDIVSATLSFRIMPYRAYSTGAASGGGSTPTSADGGSGSWDTTGPASWTLGAATEGPSTPNTTSVNPGDTEYTDPIHHHEMPTHSHTVSGDTQSSKADVSSGKDTEYEDCGGGSHRHGIPYGDSLFDGHTHELSSYNVDTNSVDPGNTYNENINHKHAMPSHYHGLNYHTHDLDGSGSDHTHELTLPNHTHTVTIAAHVHNITYAIHEESNSPTVTYAIDDGVGFGGESGEYEADAQDIDISGALTIRAGTGWKAVRFSTDQRCRIFTIIELKLDITA